MRKGILYLQTASLLRDGRLDTLNFSRLNKQHWEAFTKQRHDLGCKSSQGCTSLAPPKRPNTSNRPEDNTDTT
jgi:hypothetical protein